MVEGADMNTLLIVAIIVGVAAISYTLGRVHGTKAKKEDDFARLEEEFEDFWKGQD